MPPFRRLLRWALLAAAAAALLGAIALAIVYHVVSSRLPDVQHDRVQLARPRRGEVGSVRSSDSPRDLRVQLPDRRTRP